MYKIERNIIQSKSYKPILLCCRTAKDEKLHKRCPDCGAKMDEEVN